MSLKKQATYTEQELKDAKLAGFGRNKPKKKAFKTEKQANDYIEKYNRWVGWMKDKAKEGKEKRKKKEAKKSAKQTFSHLK